MSFWIHSLCGYRDGRDHINRFFQYQLGSCRYSTDRLESIHNRCVIERFWWRFYVLYFLFSVPEPQAQVRYCDHTLSVVRPFVLRLLFPFLTSLKIINGIQRTLTRSKISSTFVIFADQKTKMAANAYDWLRRFRHFLLNPWIKFNKTWQEARFLPCLFFCSFFWGGGVSDWLIRFRHFLLIFELNSTKLNRKQDLNVLYPFFGPTEKQDGRPCLWLTKSFSTSLIKEFNGTWSEARSQRPLRFYFILGLFGKPRCPARF